MVKKTFYAEHQLQTRTPMQYDSPVLGDQLRRLQPESQNPMRESSGFKHFFTVPGIRDRG